MNSNSQANRSTIQLLFLGLAGLTLLALGLSFGLFHHLATLHEAAVVLNRENADELSRVDRLESLEAELDAPGNDIFLSRDVARERKRVADAGNAFREDAKTLRGELTTFRDSSAIAQLEIAIAAAAVVERDAYLTIDAFSRGDLASASQAMAAMDQAHSRVFAPLQGVANALRDKESLAFKNQQSEFASIGQQESIIGIALLLLTAAILLYGRRAAREMLAAARERETYVEQLQEREQALKTAIQQRDHQTRSLETAQSIAGLGSWEWDIVNDRVEWSQELHRIFGTSPETFGASYDSYLSRVHPDDRERVDRAIRSSIGRLLPFEVEHRIIRPDGSFIILASQGNVECDASGAPVRMYCIGHDISARRASEIELQRSEERFQLASRATNDVIWDWDLMTNAVWVNQGWVQHFGYPRAGGIDITVWTDAIHSQDLGRVLASLRDVLETHESSWLDEYRIRTGRGEYRTVLNRGFIVRGAAGKPIRIIGAMMDITGRKEAEIAIARLHRETELILESAADGLFGTDLLGISTFVNPAAERILGYGPGELLGRQMHRAIHSKHEDGTDYPWNECPTCQTLANGGARSATSVFWTKSGKSLPVDLTATAILDENGVVTGSVLTFRDISERREVDRMKDEFLSTVSHELRTPLTSIRGALGLLASGRLGELPVKAARLLEIASTNTDRLVRLINDILDIERIESGKATVSRVPTDAGTLVRQATDLMRQLAEQAGITIAMSAGPAPLIADPDRIVQTLTNLIGNSIKFSPPQSTINVSAETTEGAVIFKVADAGRGIPAEKLEAVFERFKQVDASDSRDKGGSGLGLAICRSIVHQHGGEISVQSEVGHGSEFSFTIPFAPVPPAASSSLPGVSGVQRPSGMGTHQRVIFLCDEEEGPREAMKILLMAHGYRVVEFASVADLLGAALQQRPDLILLDLFMSGVDGWNALARLRNDPRIARIPVVDTSMLSKDEGEPLFQDLRERMDKLLEEGKLPPDDEIRSGSASRRMLIVEDDADLARVIASSFERYGLEVIVASTGQQAIDLAATLVPDLVVLDLMLPEVDGFGVVDWIKDHDLWRSVPLIVYSALETTASQQDRLRLGPTEFITKSRIEPEEFERRVLDLLDRLAKSAAPTGPQSTENEMQKTSPS
jgi:PAS domain S-box-containing protein